MGSHPVKQRGRFVGGRPLFQSSLAMNDQGVARGNDYGVARKIGLGLRPEDDGSLPVADWIEDRLSQPMSRTSLVTWNQQNRNSPSGPRTSPLTWPSASAASR